MEAATAPRLTHFAALRSALRRVDAEEADIAGPLSGFSGRKILSALSAALECFRHDRSACYLEVGVFQGLTLLSTAHAHPEVQCFGIDDFSLDARGENRQIIAKRSAQLGITNFTILDADYEDAFGSLGSRLDGRKLGVYFIDGPHDYRSQLMCLLLALPHLHERAVVVVDDANYRHVRQASADFLNTFPEWKLLCQAYTRCHPANMSLEEERDARRGFWNGVHVLVRDPEHELRSLEVPTERGRELFLYDHILWSSRIAERLPSALDLLRALYNIDFPRSARALYRLLRAPANRTTAKPLYDELNTYSEELPRFELVHS